MARGQRLPPRIIDDNLGVRGDSLAAEFGGVDTLNSAIGSASAPTLNGMPEPPAKATSAPKGNTKNLFTGLCEALNNFQQEDL